MSKKIVFILSCLVLSLPLMSLDSKKFELPVERFELKNGLKVLLIKDQRLPVFSLYTFYNVGGKNETKGITGASHFLEHLMFKGARKYTGTQFDYLIEGNGGTNNAFTTNDMTVYYESLPSSTLELILDIEADRMVNLLLEKESFEKERNVVLEERRMRYENSPRGQAYLNLMQELFKGTPYGTSVIGDIPDLKSVSRDQIMDYFKKFYAPNNAVLVVAGDFDLKQTKKIIEKKYGPLESSPSVAAAQAEVVDEKFKWSIKSKDMYLKGEAAAPLFMMGIPAYKDGTESAYTLNILSSLLGESKSAELIKKFVYSKKPQATSFYTGNYSLLKSGAFVFGGELVSGVDPKVFKKKLLSELKNSCQSAITERNLEKVKNQYLVEMYNQLSTNSGIAQFVGEYELVYGHYLAYEKEFAFYQKLTVNELKKSCQELLSKPVVYVVVWNKFKG